MAETRDARVSHSGRSSRAAALISVLVMVPLLACSCSKDHDEPTPPMTDTGAKPVDACRLVGNDLLDKLVGPSTMTREKDVEYVIDCRWEPKDRPSSAAKNPTGLLQISTYTQMKQVEGTPKYNDAKIFYNAPKGQGACKRLKTSADESCWQGGDSEVNVAIRKGYTAVSISYSGLRALVQGEKMQSKTAAMLAAEVLNNLAI